MVSGSWVNPNVLSSAPLVLGLDEDREGSVQGCPVLGVEPRIRRACSTKACSLLPGGDGCGTGHLIHESQGEQRPQSAAHRCRLWQRAPACKASWVGAWRRSTRPDPSTSSGESGRAAVQRHCDVGHNKGLLGGCALATGSHWLVRRECGRSCRLTSPAGMCRWSTAQGEPLRIVVRVSSGSCV